ncbi:penton protein [Human adenovirus 21a]|uniref:Penton protein n=7 Tax=Human mastadenovirus B TaxID=108098 RepID=A0A0B4SJM8_9ADEN|nr:penton protein [Human adenovirus 21a]AJA02172.1 penton protein [Human adenovirus 21]AIF29768.1 penton protein [Human adenovirus 21a]AIF29816.1 penton protein [Human adenovirus 21a]AIF29912.1 penton protein [Human adenovirus 21a]
MMRRTVLGGAVVYPEGPPPSYESVMQQAAAAAMQPPLEAPFVPPRYLAPTEGRNSIRYSELAPLYDTTRLYLVDNKSADIASLNYQNDHSNFLTTVVQNNDFTPTEASTQTINFDERSRWGGQLKTIMHTNMPNVNEYMFSNKFKARVMVSRKAPEGVTVDDNYDHKQDILEYEWFEFTLPEGNFSATMTIDLMNNAIIDNYLEVGRQNGVLESDIGVKFDTRNFRLGWDPETKLIMPGVYTYEAFHPDIVLLPGCGVDFTESRLSNLLGIRKRHPFQEGFKILYEDLEGGNIPALLDVEAYENSKKEQEAKISDPVRVGNAEEVRGDNYTASSVATEESLLAAVAETETTETKLTIKPVEKDSRGRSYNVLEDKVNTAYRSWYLSYNYGDPEKGVRSWTLLTTSDVTCGAEQVYWSLPDMMQDPVTFRSTRQVSNYPVVGAELMPVFSKSFYNEQAVYSQQLRQSTSLTHVFNRFPENQILIRPPAPTITTVSENVPALTDHGTLPLRSSIRGVQRVTVTDARRRTCPYVYKALGIVAPRVLSSRTF